MPARLVLGALAAVALTGCKSAEPAAPAATHEVAARPVAPEDVPAAGFKANLAKLADRYDDAAGDRIAKGIALCKKQLDAKADDVGARLALARFELAKGDLGGAMTAAERAMKATKDKKSDDAKQARSIGVAAMLADAEIQLPKEKDPAKADALQKQVTDESVALAELLGGDQAATAALAKEQDGAEAWRSLDEVGSSPRGIEKTDTAGKAIALDSYTGRVLLIDFWATWCGPCVGELPNVLATYEKWHAKGFEVLGVSLDDDRALLDAFVKDRSVPWRQFFDGKGWDNEVAKAFGIQAIPKTYLVDQTGKVRFVGVRGEDLGKAVQELIERAAKK